jgi:ribonuclease VapC
VTLVLDTSAVAAVVFGEPDAEVLLGILTAHAADLSISAASLVELGIVVEATQGAEATADLQTLLTTLQVTTVPVDAEQASVALAAWRRFGKGRHPAGLNFGDCFAYALAKVLGAPLLFKGRDFGLTDVSSAL